MNNEITICSVITPAHRTLFNINKSLIITLNPGIKINWVVVENPELHINKKTFQQNKLTNPKFFKKLKKETEGKDTSLTCTKNTLLLSGFGQEDVIAFLKKQYPKLNGLPEFTTFYNKYYGSYAHALALQKAVKHSKSPMTLVLDPDFYILRPNWITEVGHHISENNLSFFGAPWNPKWFQKYRNFPCVHCLFINNENVTFEEDNLFIPNLFENKHSAPSILLDIQNEKSKFSKLRKMLSRITDFIEADKFQRSSIGNSKDTGYLLKQKFKNHKNECLIPVFDSNKEAYLPLSVSNLQKNAFSELLSKNKYAPKTNEYRKDGFKKFGLPNLRKYAWEEFFWKDKPFAFHMRGENQRKLHGSMGIELLQKTLDGYIEKLN